ncbi:MAG: HAD family phosphatase [Odoribacteraceae bacterium]|jgi:putative hydrolase of the HAD superfamily|nr:HAD family phosphatase [Odoribacteraceae bacterium]
MIKNIIFDLGGVVVEWNPARVLATFTGNPALVKYVSENGFFREAWTEFDRGTIDKEEFVREWARLSDSPVEDCNALLDHAKCSLDSIPETADLIEQLSRRGFRLYCLSNMSTDHYNYLKDRPVFRFFDGQVISALEGLVKPERAFYELILERYRLTPGETLFIDDLERNIEGARKLGIHTVHFTSKTTGIPAILDIIPGQAG